MKVSKKIDADKSKEPHDPEDSDHYWTDSDEQSSIDSDDQSSIDSDDQSSGDGDDSEYNDDDLSKDNDDDLSKDNDDDLLKDIDDDLSNRNDDSSNHKKDSMKSRVKFNPTKAKESRSVRDSSIRDLHDRVKLLEEELMSQHNRQLILFGAFSAYILSRNARWIFR